jgi:hypothetical protein
LVEHVLAVEPGFDRSVKFRVGGGKCVRELVGVDGYEVLAELNRFGPIEDERIELILKMGDAEARFDAAKAALDALGEDLVGGFPDREGSDD